MQFVNTCISTYFIAVIALIQFLKKFSTLPLVRDSFARGATTFQRFLCDFCRFNLVPTQNPNFILGSRGFVNCTCQTTIWSETYITTLILLISATFEAIWGGGADLNFYLEGFQRRSAIQRLGKNTCPRCLTSVSTTIHVSHAYISSTGRTRD